MHHAQRMVAVMHGQLGAAGDPEVAEAFKAAIRLGKPTDIAALALFLCSQQAQHIQGTAIAVDGGSTVGYY
jgi:NAD(P)-dependent dehydrogenase (short-subunit alcohol dehydrogenase family)